MAFYRYVSVGEHAVVTASTPMRVPNVDRFGKPKVVYFTADLYTSAAAAEAALMIGSLNPFGVGPPPAYRLDLDLTGIAYTHHGTVAGGTGSEYTTTGSPLVTAVTGMSL